MIHSVPSPKEEPIKMWLAEPGKKRTDETVYHELKIDRALEAYTYERYCSTKQYYSDKLHILFLFC